MCRVMDSGTKMAPTESSQSEHRKLISMGSMESSRRGRNTNLQGYFLASRNLHWIPVGASLFASNIGSGHFIGLAGSGAATGIGVAGFELSANFTLMLLGWVFVPVYMSSAIYTMPEYLKERFGGRRIRVYLSFLALIIYIFTKISADLYAGALFIQLALNKSSSEWLYISILILLGVAAVFTIAGGLTAVVWTDFVQTILMIMGAFILMGFSFAKVGGYWAMVEQYPHAIAQKRGGNGTCGMPPTDYMNLFRSPHPGVSDLPWPGMTIGYTINAIWYWCSDQVIVQRTLASKNMIHAKGAVIFASYLKLLPLWLMVFPGMIARILFPDRVGCADPEECTRICGSPGGCTNIAYAELVIKLLPSGLSGLMMAVMMAALMSSLTSIFNSASTIFTIDVWTRVRKRPSEHELIVVGRMCVFALLIISVMWIPVIQATGSSNLFDYIQSISSYMAPPISAVFLLAIFWERANEPGAFWGLMIGLVIGILRFAIEFSYPAQPCMAGEDTRPKLIQLIVGNIHHLHFRCILFLVTLVVAISVSLLTKPIPKECLYRLTYWTKKSVLVRKPLEKESSRHNFKIEENQSSDCPAIVKFIYRLCGVSKGRTEAVSREVCQRDIEGVTEEMKAREAAEFLKEDPFWRK